jgi:hypothetical protein
VLSLKLFIFVIPLFIIEVAVAGVIINKVAIK